ncbi:MAG: SIMPL domain-containing protein [Planctomycetaceae bacterium]|nr:SIMPL domain-containing protein [Planctomycetaceae bacterium]
MGKAIKLAAAAAILALGLIASSVVLSKFFVNIKHEKPITVKGYAEADIVSDIGKFACSNHVRGASLKEAYDKLQVGRSAILEHLKQKGFVESEIGTGTIQTTQVNKRNDKGNETNEVEFYDANQTVVVTSGNVTRIRDAAISIAGLIKEDINISVTAPEFLVSDLKDTKLKLLAKATDDGYRRALALAENSHAKVGALVSAEQGVLQITKRNSTDTSGYGVYDTSTIEKTAKAVVTLEYRIEPQK